MLKRIAQVKHGLTSISDLILNPHRTKIHPPKQINGLMKVIEKVGFINPIIVNSDNVIVAGHARFEVAKKLGMEVVPTIQVENMTKEDMRIYMLAENRLAEMSEWDKAALAIEFQYLQKQVNFDFEIVGFDLPYVDLTIQNTMSAPVEEPIEVDTNLPVVSQLNDLWQLDMHQIYCGDALQENSYQQLMGADLAQMCFTDIPYNVRINGNVSGKGKVKHGEFAMASGEMSDSEYLGFMRTSMGLMARYSINGSIHFHFIDWRHIRDLLIVTDEVYTEYKNLCVWNKPNAGMGSMYRSKHEMVVVVKSGNEPHINNIQLGKHGRNRTNVWDYSGQNTWHANREAELAMHPTVKPVALVADAILDCSHRGGIILDPLWWQRYDFDCG